MAEPISTGSFLIIDSDGNQASGSRSQQPSKTIGDVLRRINAPASGFNVTASLNETGDGFAITDNTRAEPGTVQEVGGSVATDPADSWRRE